MYVKIIFFVMYLCVLRTLLKYYNLIKIKNLIKHHLLIGNDLWQVLYQILLKIYLKEFIEKTDGCKNNPENSFRTKLCKHIPSGYSMSTILSFKSMKNKHDVHRGKDCMKKFCEFLRERVRKISNFKKKK